MTRGHHASWTLADVIAGGRGEVILAHTYKITASSFFIDLGRLAKALLTYPSPPLGAVTSSDSVRRLLPQSRLLM